MRTETERKVIWQSHGGLAIKLNNRPFNGPCGICEDMADFVAGPEVMLGDCNEVVCRNCTRRYEPELAKYLAGEPDHFGDCPTCWHNDGFCDVGRDHWFFCRIHRFCWNVGSNLFSAWRDETEEIWQKNREMLQGYAVIEEETYRTKNMPNKPVAVSASVVGPENIPF